jgi:hypothetical protein
MERARITLITAHAAIIIGIHHLKTGSATSIPLKIVAITANLTEITRIAIDQENVLLVVTIDLVLIPTNQVCTFLMSNIIMNTNAVATRTDPTRPDTVQIATKAHNIPTPVHNTAPVINIKAINDVISIVILARLAVSSAINNRAVNLTGTTDSLEVMIVISDLFATIQGLIRRTHAGRVVQPGNVAMTRAGLKNQPGVGQNGSYSKATMSILMQITLRKPI